MTHTYRTIDVRVAGGDLTVGIWDVEDNPDAPTALLIHGITASHRSWPFVAGQLPAVRIVAPDLRGRGRSNQLDGDAGMAVHARDLAAVLDKLDIDHAVVVGHSMGAFAALVFAHLYPQRVDRIVLIDGGLPLDVPTGLSSDQVIAHVLGPAADRLAMRFESVEDYLDFWRQHPAFAGDWSAGVEDYLTYDLVGVAPELHPSTSYEVMTDDTIDLNTGDAIVKALTSLAHPTLFVTAPKGLFDQVPGLYAGDRLKEMLVAMPNLRHQEIPDVNHYTIVMSDRGAAATAKLIAEEVAASRR